MSGINVTKVSQREKTFIDNQRNVIRRQSSVSVRKIDQRTEISRPLTLDKTPAVRKDSSDLSISGRRKSVNIIRISLFSKSSVEPERRASIVSIKIQPRKSSHRDLTGSGIIRTNQSSAPTVSVSKIQRSTSADQTKRTPTASTNTDLSRVTTIKIK